MYGWRWVGAGRSEAPLLFRGVKPNTEQRGWEKCAVLAYQCNESSWSTHTHTHTSINIYYMYVHPHAYITYTQQEITWSHIHQCSLTLTCTHSCTQTPTNAHMHALRQTAWKWQDNHHIQTYLQLWVNAFLRDKLINILFSFQTFATEGPNYHTLTKTWQRCNS